MFEEIDGHSLAKKTLQRAASDERIAHAYLFSGPEGVGKKLTAISFAKELICPEKRGRAESAHRDCPVCERIDAKIHPDVSLFEYKDKNAITVDNVRNGIERGIFLKPFESQYKIFIVDGAQRMNSNAQNAFLKTLEEPPPYSVIILITDLPLMILPTIRSRCHTVGFGKLDGTVAREKLNEKGELSAEEIELAVKITDGSPGKALKITSEEAGKIVETVKALAGIDARKPSEVFAFVENLLGKAKGNAEQRVQAENFAEFTALWIRDLLRASAGANEFTYGALSDVSADFARRRKPSEIVEKALEFENTMAGIKARNLNCRIALENFVLKIANI